MSRRDTPGWEESQKPEPGTLWEEEGEGRGEEQQWDGRMQPDRLTKKRTQVTRSWHSWLRGERDVLTNSVPQM